jgi:MFS transporter, FHS family, glucose/mannose:H+ symporter
VKQTEKRTITSQENRQRTLLTCVACFVYLAYALTANGWGPLLVPMATQLTLSLDKVGLLFVAWLVGYLPGTLVGGSLFDRFGSRIILFFASLTMIAGIAALLFSLFLHVTLLAELLICIGVAGMGGGAIEVSTTGLISATYVQKRGVALNLFTLLYPLSSMLISLVDGGLLTLFHDDPRPSLVFGACIILLSMLSILLLPVTSRQVGTDHMLNKSPSSSSKGLQLSITLRALLPVFLAILFAAGITATIRTWTPAYLHVEYGQTPVVAAFISGIMNGLVIFFRLLASLVVGRIGSWRTVVFSMLVAIGGLIGVLCSSNNALVGTIFITITAIGLTPVVATLVSIGNDRAGTSFGSVTGMLFFTIGISNILCSWLFGVLLHQRASWAITFCLTSMICGVAITLSLREHQTKL